MSTVPSSVTEATTRRASSFPTYFASRVVLTGFDALVFVKSALAGLRNSLGMPLLHWLLIAAVGGIALSLANVWYKTLRYRQPSRPNTRNPFL